MSDRCVSVVIPVYRPGIFFEEAVRSVLDQRLPPGFGIELVVVFDGPDAAAQTLLKGLCPEAVVVVHPENRGPSAARNSGIRKATGEFVAFIDADDRWVKNRIVRDLEIFAEGEQKDGVPFSAVCCLNQIIYKNARESWNHQQFNWIFLMGAMVCRREVFEEVGLLDEDLRFGEDSDWFFRLWESESGFRIRWEVGLLYRVHSGGMTWGKPLEEKGHLKAIKKSLDRRRRNPGHPAVMLSNPEPSLPLADHSLDPGRAISIFRCCLREKWRYFDQVLPISFICDRARMDSSMATSCRQTIEFPTDSNIPWSELLLQCSEPFVAIEVPGSQSHPLRLLEQLATFDLYPQCDVALAGHVSGPVGQHSANVSPEISSFLARTDCLKKVEWNVAIATPPRKAMFTLFCEWKRMKADIKMMPWALTAF